MYSNDFSLLALFTAGLAALTSAYHAPVGDPSGNPIDKPGLNEVRTAEFSLLQMSYFQFPTNGRKSAFLHA
jgi:hypothetical protein